MSALGQKSPPTTSDTSSASVTTSAESSVQSQSNNLTATQKIQSRVASLEPAALASAKRYAIAGGMLLALVAIVHRVTPPSMPSGSYIGASIILTLLTIAFIMALVQATIPEIAAQRRDQRISITMLRLAAILLLVGAAITDLSLSFSPRALLGHDAVILFVAASLLTERCVGSLVAKKGKQLERTLRLEGSQLVRVIEAFAPDTPSSVLQEHAVQASALKVGQVIRVAAGELIAADALVLHGKAEVEERRLIGGTVASIRTIGQDLYAGSRVLKGEVVCRVMAAFDESMHSTFQSILSGALFETDQVAQHAIAFERVFSLSVVSVALLEAFFWQRLGAPMSVVLTLSAAVLLSGLFATAVLQIAAIRRRSVASAYHVGALLKRQELIDELNNLTHLAFDYEALGKGSAPIRVTYFQLTDQRVDETMLLSVVLALWSQSEDERGIALRRFVHERLGDQAKILEVADAHFYPGLGICGLIEHQDFTMGSEDFLIERGVYLQASDLERPSKHEEALYVAISDEIVARFILRADFADELRRAQPEFSALGVKSFLLTKAETQIADEIGKRAGLELAQIAGGLSAQSYQEKLATLRPVALYAAAHSDQALLDHASVSLAVFNELLWDVERAKVVLFSRDLTTVVKLFRIAKKDLAVNVQSLFFGALISGALLTPSLLGYPHPMIVALGSAIATAILLLNVLRIDPR